MSWIAAALVVLCFAAPAAAKTFRYASGPKPPADTLGWEAQSDLEPLMKSQHPRVPMTNLQLTGLVADTAFARAMRGMPLESGVRVVLAPSESHPMNPLIERSLLRQLSRRGLTAGVRRTVIPDDSLRAVASEGEPVLEYSVTTARVTYLRLVGMLPGRVKIERQALVEGGLVLLNPANSTVMWSSDATFNLVDRFPRPN
ncbi:MAG: hypothetical protein ACRENS_07490, partial [Candidatus Eiseniibacteriota bacterium]